MTMEETSSGKSTHVVDIEGSRVAESILESQFEFYQAWTSSSSSFERWDAKDEVGEQLGDGDCVVKVAAVDCGPWYPGRRPACFAKRRVGKSSRRAHQPDRTSSPLSSGSAADDLAPDNADDLALAECISSPAGLLEAARQEGTQAAPPVSLARRVNTATRNMAAAASKLLSDNFVELAHHLELEKDAHHLELEKDAHQPAHSQPAHSQPARPNHQRQPPTTTQMKSSPLISLLTPSLQDPLFADDDDDRDLLGMAREEKARSNPSLQDDCFHVKQHFKDHDPPNLPRLHVQRPNHDDHTTHQGANAHEHTPPNNDSRNHTENKRLQKNVKMIRYFHSDHSLTAWVWAPDRNTNSHLTPRKQTECEKDETDPTYGTSGQYGSEHRDNGACTIKTFPRRQAELDLTQTLVRGRVVHAKLPLLAVVSNGRHPTDLIPDTIDRNTNSAHLHRNNCHDHETSKTETDKQLNWGTTSSTMTNNDQHWSKRTNLHWLHKSTTITVKRIDSQNNPRKVSEQIHETNDHSITDIHSETGSYSLYQTRHPCLAPLISMTKCHTTPAYQQEHEMKQSILSVFDITPSCHRPLHELLRHMGSDEFLTMPLFPGMIGHTPESLGDESLQIFGDDQRTNAISHGHSFHWLDGNEEEEEDMEGLCQCRELLSDRKGDRDGFASSKKGARIYSSSTTSTSSSTTSSHKIELREVSSFTSSALSSLSEHPPSTESGGASSVPPLLRRWKDNRSSIHHPQHYSRNKRPRKRFRVGTTYRANVADLRIRFLALQLFHAVHFCHSRGVALGDQLHPDRIFVQEDGWVRLVVPIVWMEEKEETVFGTTSSADAQSILAESTKFQNAESLALGTKDQFHDSSNNAPNNCKTERRAIFSRFENFPIPTTSTNGALEQNSRNLLETKNDCHSVGGRSGVTGPGYSKIIPYPGYGDVPTVQWQKGQISNLAYLMMINAAAGRTIGDQFCPPILPWVTDFSSEIDLDSDMYSFGWNNKSPWRDLSKSKFRLKKGDEQLDQTFLHAMPPHHIPENISDLTYTVYRARCLPIRQLRSTVRDVFVPEHYPDSLARLYQWTPDEATFEFYMRCSHPCIFRSKHKEMRDLSLPQWCGKSPANFLAYHRSLLESDFVSRNLHLWIDLNFGDALAGRRAIAEKNVVLHRVSWDGGSCSDEFDEVRCLGECHSIFSDLSINGGTRVSRPNARKSAFVQLFLSPHPKKHANLRKALSSAFRNVPDDHDVVEKPCGINRRHYTNSNRGISDFILRRRRDISTLGAIVKECYASARVVPPPAVDTAINELLFGALDIRLSLRSIASGDVSTGNTFPFPPHLKEAYQTLSELQDVTFQREPSNPNLTDGNEITFRSTALDRVWMTTRIARNPGLLSSSSIGLILPGILVSISRVDPFIENGKLIGKKSNNFVIRPYAALSDRLCELMIFLSKKIPADLITPYILSFLDSSTKYDSTSYLNILLLSQPLFSSLYSHSCGEYFVQKFSEFIVLLLCRNCEATMTTKLNALHKKTIIVLASLIADQVLGQSICCHYLVPLLVQNIHRSPCNPGNYIIQSLKSILPYLPEDAVGVLVCKPILRNVIPAQLTQVGLSKRVTVKKAHLNSVGSSKACALLIESTSLLRTCLRHFDPDCAIKYFFRSNSDSIPQLLLASLELRISTCAPMSDCSDSGTEDETDDDPKAHESKVLYRNEYEEATFLLNEASVLVQEMVDRIDLCHFQESIFNVVEKFCSRVNDEYSALAMRRSGFLGANFSFGKEKVMLLPGVEAAMMLSSEVDRVCGKEILRSQCPSAHELQVWVNSRDDSLFVEEEQPISVSMRGSSVEKELSVRKYDKQLDESTSSNDTFDACEEDDVICKGILPTMIPTEIFKEGPKTDEQPSIEMLAPKTAAKLYSKISDEDSDEDCSDSNPPSPTDIAPTRRRLSTEDSSFLNSDHKHSPMESLEESDRTSSNIDAIDNLPTISQTPHEQDRRAEKKRELAWLLGLHKQEKANTIKYSWQPRMMLTTALFADEVSDGHDDRKKRAAFKSMATNRSESTLIAGDSLGEVLLFDLRSQPPALRTRRQFFNDHDTKDKLQSIVQLDFFDYEDSVLVCNGSLHLWDTEAQNIIRTLSPRNSIFDNNIPTQNCWQGDNFLGFSVFPKSTGLGEIIGGIYGEIAAISSNNIYIMDIRCQAPVACYHQLLHSPTTAYVKHLQLDPMIRNLTWCLDTSPRFNYSKSHKSRKKDEAKMDTSSCYHTCIATHCGDGDWICVGSGSGHIHLFDRRYGKLITCWKAHSKSVEYLKAVSLNLLLSVSGDKTAILWNIAQTPPQKISRIYNIPGKEHGMHIAAHHFFRDGLVAAPGGDFILCAVSGRKAIFMPMPLTSVSKEEQQGLKSQRIVMCDYKGNQLSSSEKLDIHSVALLPCRQLVLLGCEGKIHVCL